MRFIDDPIVIFVDHSEILKESCKELLMLSKLEVENSFQEDSKLEFVFGWTFLSGRYLLYLVSC